MKKLGFVLAIMVLMGTVAPVAAVDFSFHGDMNNRFLIYTNRQDLHQPAGLVE
jgi:hypothetical protein